MHAPPFQRLKQSSSVRVSSTLFVYGCRCSTEQVYITRENAFFPTLQKKEAIATPLYIIERLSYCFTPLQGVAVHPPRHPLTPPPSPRLLKDKNKRV